MNSDDGGPRTGGGGDDEVALPKSTINKLIAESLPAGFSAAKEVKDLMAECCKEFLLAVSSEANEICEKDSKKTMLPDHILSALKALGFEEFVSGVEDVLADHKEGEKAKKAKKAAGNGMTEAEMLRIQEELFAKSRARMDAGEESAPAAPGEGETKEEKQEE
ncbi:negative cofactor 2 transcription regulator complex subunit ncb2 [Rhodotorula toruloides]